MIKKYRNSFVFPYWHHFGLNTCTAIRWQRTWPGLIGIRFIVSEYNRNSVEEIEIALWKGLRFSLLAIHPNALK